MSESHDSERHTAFTPIQEIEKVTFSGDDKIIVIAEE